MLKFKKGDKVKFLSPSITVRRLNNGRRSAESKTGTIVHINGHNVHIRPARWPIGYSIELTDEDIKHG